MIQILYFSETLTGDLVIQDIVNIMSSVYSWKGVSTFKQMLAKFGEKHIYLLCIYENIFKIHICSIQREKGNIKHNFDGKCNKFGVLDRKIVLPKCSSRNDSVEICLFAHASSSAFQ